jgi:hypothetical protein
MFNELIKIKTPNPMKPGIGVWSGRRDSDPRP